MDSGDEITPFQLNVGRSTPPKEDRQVKGTSLYVIYDERISSLVPMFPGGQ